MTDAQIKHAHETIARGAHINGEGHRQATLGREDWLCQHLREALEEIETLRAQWEEVFEAMDMRKGAKPENCVAMAKAFNYRNDQHVALEDGLRAEIRRLRALMEESSE